MGHENGGKQRLAKRRHVQGMLDETDPLIFTDVFEAMDYWSMSSEEQV